jgi:hypothetical protein
MSRNAKPPALVRAKHRAEVERLSKAALVDMVWSFAVRCAGNDLPAEVMAEFRREREAVLTARD